MPLAPHFCDVPGVQPVWFVQADQAVHEPLPRHLRVWIPLEQFPHVLEFGPGHGHLPSMQPDPSTQELPHDPQFKELVCRFSQTPGLEPHRVVSLGHTQLSREQMPPAGHCTQSPPQFV